MAKNESKGSWKSINVETRLVSIVMAFISSPGSSMYLRNRQTRLFRSDEIFFLLVRAGIRLATLFQWPCSLVGSSVLEPCSMSAEGWYIR